MKNNHLSAAETCPKVSGSFFALSSVAQTKTVISTNIQVVKFAFVCVCCLTAHLRHQQRVFLLLQSKLAVSQQSLQRFTEKGATLRVCKSSFKKKNERKNGQKNVFT